LLGNGSLGFLCLIVPLLALACLIGHHWHNHKLITIYGKECRRVGIGELDKKSGDLLEEVYHWVDCPMYRLPLKEAEMQKFVHNLCNATKISFFNEMRLVCRQIGLDCEKIFPLVAQSAESIWNPIYGTRDLGPFGGKCLPKDTAAFLSWAKEQGVQTPLVNAALKVNQTLERAILISSR
jgi:UDP-glucose 6-dehydrogenase